MMRVVTVASGNAATVVFTLDAVLMMTSRNVGRSSVRHGDGDRLAIDFEHASQRASHDLGKNCVRSRTGFGEPREAGRARRGAVAAIGGGGRMVGRRRPLHLGPK